MKTIRHPFTSALAATALLAASPLAMGVVIYSNDFNSETAGAVNANSAEGEWNHAGGGGAYTDFVVAGSSPNFTTQHVELASRSNNGNYGFGNFNGGNLTTDPGFASVTTFSFDAFFSTAAFVGNGSGQFRMRARDTAFSGGTTDTVRVDIDDEDFGTDPGDLAADQVVSIQYVVNNSTASADAPDVGGTIASGTYAVYIDGTLFQSGTNFTTADDLAVDKLTLWVQGDTAGPAQSIVRIDNFEVHVNPIPEPSAIALLGLGGLGLLVRRRK